MSKPTKPVNPHKPTAAEKTKISQGLSTLEAILVDILPIYLQSSNANKILIRQHNPTFDSFVSLLEKYGAFI